ncbi:MAG: hypothetical protein ACOZAO_00790 [Patescibacteria group bacterium]
MNLLGLILKLKEAGEDGIPPKDFFALGIPEEGTVAFSLLCMLVKEKDGKFVFNGGKLAELRDTLAPLANL